MKNSQIFTILITMVAIFFASCDILEDTGKRSVVYLQVDNTRNCTDVVIEDTRTGEAVMVVLAGRMKQEKVSASIFDWQEETTLFAHTPYEITDRILAGDTSVIPKGCDDWGTDTERIRLRDGYDTVEFRVHLDPPRHWERPRDW